MSAIDLKLKSYDELIFEITTLTTNNYLLQQKVEQLEKEVYYQNKEVTRLNIIINYIWQVFENGSFEDGCDCIKIYDYLKELKEE